MDSRPGHWKLGLLALGSLAFPSTLSAAVMLDDPIIDVQETCTKLQDLFPDCSNLYPDLPSCDFGFICDDFSTQTLGDNYDLLVDQDYCLNHDTTSFVNVVDDRCSPSLPEPASLLLLTTGLAALGARRGLRRKSPR